MRPESQRLRWLVTAFAAGFAAGFLTATIDDLVMLIARRPVRPGEDAVGSVGPVPPRVRELIR
ncbi:hypothetical protein [Dactylosporangium sp. NPDC051484]|uniref:hypothetical protein n=1 Tax=Dactylosporangium sp. NPDC051484 TaxID=3154942 RepID=UPI00344B1A0E